MDQNKHTGGAPEIADIEETGLRMFSGQIIDLEKGPRPGQITIDDIAHNLAMICRFNGSVKQFYSVAEHSVYISRYAPPMHRLYYLLHDASEAFTNDLTSPMKKLIWGKDYKNNPDYKRVFEKFDKAVMEAFNLSYHGFQSIYPEIKKAEAIVYKLEKRILFNLSITDLKLEKTHPLFEAVWGMDNIDAESLFLQQFETISER